MLSAGGHPGLAVAVAAQPVTIRRTGERVLGTAAAEAPLGRADEFLFVILEGLLECCEEGH